MATNDHAAPRLPPLREVIKAHGIGARKSLGQHFLFDANLAGRIVRAAGDLTACTVIEVGPGPGGLTRALLAAGASRVVAVERDDRCLSALEELAAAYPGRLEIVADDAIKVDPATLAAAPRKIVANLPYNISTPLLIGWLRHADAYQSMTLMFQKEVADRLSAKAGTKSYGRLSVLTQWLCAVRHDFNVDRRAFTPPPKVTSSVMTLTPRPEPLAPAAFESVEAATAAAFGQRRKMLRASLRSFGLDLEALGIDPTARGESLSVEEFCRIARAIAGET